MKTTFTTSGVVDAVHKEDGSVFGYKVGRKNAGTIFTTKVIDEFFKSDVAIHVDKYGGFWAKKA